MYSNQASKMKARGGMETYRRHGRYYLALFSYFLDVGFQHIYMLGVGSYSVMGTILLNYNIVQDNLYCLAYRMLHCPTKQMELRAGGYIQTHRLVLSTYSGVSHFSYQNIHLPCPKSY